MSALVAGMGIRWIAREHKVGVGTVLRVQAEMAALEDLTLAPIGVRAFLISFAD